MPQSIKCEFPAPLSRRLHVTWLRCWKLSLKCHSYALPDCAMN